MWASFPLVEARDKVAAATACGVPSRILDA
jgi:hypothetical protein